MSNTRDTYSWLFDESEKEKELKQKIKEERERFESTPEYLEHDKKLEELYAELTEESAKRRAEGRKHRKHDSRNTIVIPELTPEERAERRKLRFNGLSENLQNLISDFNDLSNKDKSEFDYFVHRPALDSYGNLENYKDPVTTKEDIKRLLEILVQTCIDFINEKGLTDVDLVSFQADGLQVSSKHGEWTPTTDASIRVEGLQPEEGSNDPYPVRKNIGKCM